MSLYVYVFTCTNFIYMSEEDWNSFIYGLKTGCTYIQKSPGVGERRDLCSFKGRYYIDGNGRYYFHVSNDARRKIARFLKKDGKWH